MSNTPAVCHIPPVETVTQPPAHNLQSVAPAQPNIQSLTATVNQLRSLLIQFMNRKAVWQEQSRTTENVKITDPNNPSSFVVVQRINKLVMVDKVTNQTWTWTRTHNG